MAKTNTPAVSSVMLPFALIWWNLKENRRSEKNYGTDKEKAATVESLADKEWVDNYPIPVYEISEADAATCMAERQAQWDTLKAATSPDGLVQKAVFEKLFLDEKGKLIKPEYSGNAGFRRASLYFKAMVERFKRTEGKEVVGLIPAKIKHYESIADRLIDQQLENELQGVGAVPMDMLDRLRVTQDLFDNGCKEVAVRKLYTATTGQKLFGICLLNFYFPKQRIMERLFLPADHVDHIPINKLRHDALVQLNNRWEAQQKRDAGRPMTDKERAMAPLKEEEVATYLSDQKKAADDGQSKIMARKDVEQGSKTNKIGFVRAAFQAVMDNSTIQIAPYLAFADGLNLHKELIDTNRGQLATDALLLAADSDSVINLLVTAKKDGKLDAIRAAINATLNPPAPPAPTPAPAPVVTEPAPAAPTPAPAPVVESAPAAPAVTEPAPAPAPEPAPVNGDNKPATGKPATGKPAPVTSGKGGKR